MRRFLRLMLWPGVLVLLTIAILGINAALVIIAANAPSGGPS